MPNKSKSYEKSAPRVYIRTFGCQMNEHDSEIMRGLLLRAGYVLCVAEKEADIILFNTCCVRKHAEERVWGKMGMLSKLRREKPHLVFGVLGCMAQARGKKIFERLPFVNLVCGPKALYHLPELLSRADTESRILDIEEPRTADKRMDAGVSDFERVSFLPRVRESKISAWVAIMEGCNNFCSYCVVPYVRGVERSRPVEDIVHEVEELGRAGYKEVTLLGQNVNSYGRSLVYRDMPESETTGDVNGNGPVKIGGAREHDEGGGGMDFVRLLEELNRIEGLVRIRFVTSHPKDAHPGLFEAMARLDKVCEHIHLPVQSGSDRILGIMNRKYTRRHYLELIKMARGIVPGISFSTDIIVGFPTESEDDFEDTCRLMREVEFDSTFIFKYSPRPYTAAGRLRDDVPMDIKLRRNHRLLEIQERISLAKNKSFVGKEVEALVEGPAPRQKDALMGRTRTGRICIFEAGIDCIGKVVNFKVEKAAVNSLQGKIIDGGK